MARTINLGHPVRNIAHKSIEFQCCPSSLRLIRTDCNKVVPFGPVGEPLYEGGRTPWSVKAIVWTRKASIDSNEDL